MNLALPLLVLLSLAGLLTRRELGIPWAVCGLAGIALLHPALRIEDGTPSPAATLAHHAPWQGVADPAAGNPNLRDITHQVQPWLLFLRNEMRDGRLPFWDPYQFSGSPYWSNGSGAPLFPLHLLFAALPVQLGFLLLPWLRVVIGGCGAFALARELGASRPAALLAALIFPMSGMITSFLLFPMGNTHALVPWVLLAVERLASGKGSWSALAVAGGLQLLGGHPETPVFTAMLAGVYLLVRGSARPVAAWAGFLGGWIAALAISAVQILPLYKTVLDSGKWLHWDPSTPPPLGVVGALWLRFLLPDLFGHPAHGTWWGPYNFAATAVYAGVLTIPLAVAGVAAARGDRRWLAVAVMTILALLCAYHLPGFRQVLLTLPVIKRGIHHYLKFGVELGLALLAAAGCDRWLEGKGRGILLGTAFGVLLLGVAWWRFSDDWAARGLMHGQSGWISWATVLLLGIALSLRLSAKGRWAVWPLLPALLVIDLVIAHAPTNPGLSVAKLYPETGAVRFLQGKPERMAGLGTAFHPDAAMVHGVYDVRGDSPVKLHRYEKVYDELGTGDPVYFHPIDDWADPWLDRLGVRWVMGGPAEAPPPGVDWKLAYQGPDARIWERPRALPLARLSGPARNGRVTVEKRVPGAWTVSFDAPQPGRLVVAETWDPGWSATLDGEPVPVDLLRGLLLSVRVGPGPGRIDLRYHPDGIVPGTVLSLLGLAAVGADGLRRRRRLRLYATRNLNP